MPCWSSAACDGVDAGVGERAEPGRHAVDRLAGRDRAFDHGASAPPPRPSERRERHRRAVGDRHDVGERRAGSPISTVTARLQAAGPANSGLDDAPPRLVGLDASGARHLRSRRSDLGATSVPTMCAAARSSHAMPGGSAPSATSARYGRPARGLAVVVRAEAPGHEPQAVGQRVGVAHQVRVGGAGLEPAVGAGAAARQHDARLPRVPEHHVEAVRAPDGQHVQRVAACHEDHVLRQHERTQVLDRALEQLEIARLERVRGEGAVEHRHAAIVVTGRRGHVEHLGFGRIGQLEQERIDRIRGPLPSAHRHDVAFGHDSSIGIRTPRSCATSIARS